MSVKRLVSRVLQIFRSTEGIQDWSCRSPLFFLVWYIFKWLGDSISFACCFKVLSTRFISIVWAVSFGALDVATIWDATEFGETPGFCLSAGPPLPSFLSMTHACRLEVWQFMFSTVSANFVALQHLGYGEVRLRFPGRQIRESFGRGPRYFMTI